MSIKRFFLQFFTWWNGENLNTRFHTWRFGNRIGEDEAGNVYYQSKAADSEGRPRRWVIYNGISEASKVSPGWHGWLHHRVDVPPTRESYVAREWQKPHVPNLTGTPDAYRPKGSLLSGTKRPVVTGDYDAWTPGG